MIRRKFQLPDWAGGFNGRTPDCQKISRLPGRQMGNSLKLIRYGRLLPLRSGSVFQDGDSAILFSKGMTRMRSDKA